MTRANPDAETALEQAAIACFQSLGWETANCYHETFGPESMLGRDNPGEVVLERRLRPALGELNPGISPVALEIAVENLTRGRSVLNPVRANAEIYKLLKDGIRVSYRRPEDGEEAVENVKVIDWDQPGANDFFLASQFWISGDYGNKRADLIGFVNGLPLVFLELKASQKALLSAYKYNLSDYRDTVPQVFWYNAFIILSNGSQSRIGSVTAGWEHFAEWKKINDEGEEGVVSLETMLRGVCDPARLLDLVENFMLFSETKGEVSKLIAKNHQFLGVNNAIAAVQKIRENQGKLGVFWHTPQSQNEIEEFKKKGLDIATHRKRMVKEDLETKFKNPDDSLRIAFVCAMWITGFDVPSCSTIYLDKPMKNHTLMQTIARANRVWREKQNGLIVDYVGIFRNLQRALAIYGTTQGGDVEPGDTPIKDKAELVRQLREAIAEATAFCIERGVDPAKIRDSQGFDRERLKDDAVAAIVVNDDTRRRYLNLAAGVAIPTKTISRSDGMSISRSEATLTFLFTKTDRHQSRKGLLFSLVRSERLGRDAPAAAGREGAGERGGSPFPLPIPVES